jgi:hypothetical protein
MGRVSIEGGDGAFADTNAIKARFSMMYMIGLASKAGVVKGKKRGLLSCTLSSLHKIYAERGKRQFARPGTLLYGLDGLLSGFFISQNSWTEVPAA